ncbi:MAG: hypothetical protein Q4G64_04245 [bacterium]|nr:hypothetical protein [bacterium]
MRHGVGLEPGDVVEIGGIKVCTLERLIMDMARFRHPRQSIPIGDAALAILSGASNFDQERTVREADKIRARFLKRAEALRGYRGIKQARTVIDFLDPLSQSIGESVLRWGLAAFGLTVVSQHPVSIDGAPVYFLDLLAVRYRIVFEFDGELKYEGDGGLLNRRREAVRDHDLVALGFVVFHFGWEDILTVRAVGQAITRAVGMAVLDQHELRMDLWDPLLAA